MSDQGTSSQDGGSITMLVQTISLGSYPATAVAFYAVSEVFTTGPEIEGGTPTYSVSSAHFFAANTGTAIPPNGTRHMATRKGGRWGFRYDG